MKYRKKPIVIDAVQYTGTDENKIKIWNFCKGKQTYVDENGNYVIPTLEGHMKASIGDFIIKGVNGEFYPCKPDIFEKTYEAVNETESVSVNAGKMKSYDNDMFEESVGTHTVEITLQQREYVGHITQRISGYCKGLELLDYNFECEDGSSENDCNLKYDEDCGYFFATLKNPEGDTLDVEGYAEEFNNMIVKMEIVDYIKAQVF